jgi:hypothetical protein
MKYYDKDRMLCLATYLFNLEEHNRLAQNGLLNRFSLNCYGEQKTLETIRSEKAVKFRELIKKSDSKEYEMWFLKYSPHKKYDKKGEKRGKREEQREGEGEEQQEGEVNDKKRVNSKKDKKEENNKRFKNQKKREPTIIQKLIKSSKTRKNRKNGFLF